MYTSNLSLSPAVTAPNLTLSPSTLTFSYQSGGTVPAAQNVGLGSSGAALSYTVATSATWLTATPASGTTPGTLSVGVSPASLAVGTYTGTVAVTATGAGNSPQSVAVTLVVSSPGSGALVTNPKTLWFSSGHEGEREDGSSTSRALSVSSTGGPLQFTAEALGGSWLSVSPAGGTTTARLTVTVSAAGLARGSYKGQIRLSAPGVASITVPITFTVGGRESEDDHESFSTTTYTYDPANTGAVVATWVTRAGVPPSSPADPTVQGLVLTNNVGASSKARAGVLFNNVAGITLTELGFDLRQGSLCTVNGPRFIVVTSDGVVHAMGGCSASTQVAPASGWRRFRFTPAKAVPAIAPDAVVKSIALMLDDGPEKGGGMAVLDNIDVNGSMVGHE